MREWEGTAGPGFEGHSMKVLLLAFETREKLFLVLRPAFHRLIVASSVALLRHSSCSYRCLLTSIDGMLQDD